LKLAIHGLLQVNIHLIHYWANGHGADGSVGKKMKKVRDPNRIQSPIVDSSLMIWQLFWCSPWICGALPTFVSVLSCSAGSQFFCLTNMTMTDL
jgi:hypothetical protein